jgi:large-conductance mechanosensitive channel
MISFLLEEGVLTVGALSGIFTTGLLNSLKANIIDPSIEKIVPSHKLDCLPPKPSTGDDKSNFTDMFPLPMGTPPPRDNNIRWQTFLKDLITWIILMFFLYIIWKKYLHPIKVAKFNVKPLI